MKFKVGDVVKLISDYYVVDDEPLKSGDVGVIIKEEETPFVPVVKFFNGITRYCFPRLLEKVETNEI